MFMRPPIIRTITSGLVALSTALVGLSTIPMESNAGLIFRFPPNPGPPGRRVPGGSRPGDRCMETGLTMVALMPNTTYGLTASSLPTWYFYLPNLQADGLQFQLFDPQTQTIQTQSYLSPQEEGIYEVRSPSELVPNRPYQWNFSIICDQQKPSHNIVVNGTLKRHSTPEIIAQLDGLSGADRLPPLIEAGLWHDTLQELATLRNKEPSNSEWTARWSELLELPEVAFEQVSPDQTKRMKVANIIPLKTVQTLDESD